MYKIVGIIVFLCSFLSYGGQDPCVVETTYDTERSTLTYTVRLATFDKNAPSSKWKELIEECRASEEMKQEQKAGIIGPTYAKLNGLYYQRRYHEGAMREKLREEMAALGRVEEARAVVKCYIQPYVAFLSRATVSYGLVFSQEGHLLQLGLSFLLKDKYTGEPFFPEIQCQELFAALDKVKILSPWEGDDLYNIQLYDHVELDTIQ